MVLVSSDYEKYFDSFDYDFIHSMMMHLGLPKQLCDMNKHLYRNMQRVLKRGKALSLPFQAYNRYGQGDVLSLLPALLLVSWQSKTVDAIQSSVKKGSQCR